MVRMIAGVRVLLAVLVVATVAFLAATPVALDQVASTPAANPVTLGKAITGGGMHGRAVGDDDCAVGDR